MTEKKIGKIGFYTIYEIKSPTKIVYRVDSGKTIFIPKFNKTMLNQYRDVKEFSSLKGAKDYVGKKLLDHKKKKEKKIKELPKSLYLVLIKEESTNNIFVKVGFTSKKFIMRRFSKMYGYDGYVLDTILRRIDTPYAEKLESEIKEKINKKRSIKKYRPILESFSGYSECFDLSYLDDIVKIFDAVVNKY